MPASSGDSIPTIRGPAAGCLSVAVRLAAGFFMGSVAFSFVYLRLQGFSRALAAIGGIVVLAIVFDATLWLLDRVIPRTSSLGSGLLAGHWSQMIEGLTASPTAFYEELTEALSDRQIPELAVSRAYAREGGVLSAKRLYLAAQRQKLSFLVCGAPFGNGFFVSWWLLENRGFWREVAELLPLGTVLLPFLFRARTYYEIDTTLMFKDLTHSAVLAVVDGLVESKGLRGLTELERRPILRDPFRE